MDPSVDPSVDLEVDNVLVEVPSCVVDSWDWPPMTKGESGILSQEELEEGLLGIPGP